ncbi:AAA family ATPase, partial [Candidatus Micrarchaeota archaeon]|nr:AAA family ATPase [Candidatus Micrarchaeota archaeon]
MALAGKTTPGVSSGGSNKAAIPTPKNIAPNSLIVVPTAPYRRYAGPLIAKLEKYKALVDSKKLDDPLAKKLFGGELLIGPPGTSKTHFAKYIAQETGAAYFSVPALTGPEEVTFLFMQAREAAKNGPVIIMINEIECVGKREGGMLPQHQMYTLSTLLSELEDPRNIGVFVFFTSNAPELIDLAIRRPPRTVGEIFFAPPTWKERREMFIEELKSSGMKCPDEVIEYALSLTPGYVPGDIFGTAQKMIESAIFHKRNHFEKQDVDFAKELVKPSAMRDLPWVEPQIRMQHLTGNYILSAKDMLTRLGTRIDNGMRLIIYGPTGCGKTSICEALAGEFGYNLVIFDASDIVTKWVGEPGKIIGRILDHSKTFAPCVIVIDQSEGVIAPENPYSSEWT